MHDTSPALIICCWLCGDRIDATQQTAWGSTIDHALDAHLDYLRADPDRVWDAMTVSPAVPARALSRPSTRPVPDVLP